MISNLSPITFVILVFGVVIFILVMFLPALLEPARAKKPNDAGPRRIRYDIVLKPQGHIVLLATIEEEIESDHALIKKIAGIIAVLPNLKV